MFQQCSVVGLKLLAFANCCVYISRNTRSANSVGVRILRNFRILTQSLFALRIAYTSNMATWFHAAFNNVTGPRVLTRPDDRRLLDFSGSVNAVCRTDWKLAF